MEFSSQENEALQLHHLRVDWEFVKTTVVTGEFLITPLAIDVEVLLKYSPKGSSALFLKRRI